MIFKGFVRGSVWELVFYFFNVSDNEYVEVYDLCGFLSDDLIDVFIEVECVVKGIWCLKYLFLFSLNLLFDVFVFIKEFEVVLERIEVEFVLEECLRVIVFYEKDGRCYCYVVWSWIDS